MTYCTVVASGGLSFRIMTYCTVVASGGKFFFRGARHTILESLFFPEFRIHSSSRV